MVNIKKAGFKFEKKLGKGLVNAIFEITGLTKLDKEVLKWQLKEFEIIFEEQGRIVIKCCKSTNSETVSELIIEIEKYIYEKKEKIKKALEDAFELRRFLNVISDVPEDIEEAE